MEVVWKKKTFIKAVPTKDIAVKMKSIAVT
jgi:hypothetical protein